MNSPLGNLKLISSKKGLAAILWENDNPKRVKISAQNLNPNDIILVEAVQQLQRYFTKKHNQFTLDLDIQGSDFQKQVWQLLLEIPYGKTVSYIDIACRMGQPTAARAVGMAVGKNPLSIIVPCHRVIGSTGRLTGFAGGLEAKKFLLELEKNVSFAV
jgi:methylated-DNA-[protein]-cysteine S-methyltransferase